VRITSAIAIYFIIWWVTLFAVLPFGVRNAHEAGEKVEPGHEAGAPVNPQLGKKALITTVVATALFVAVYLIITSGWVSG
jgi:predicted secreted protein